MTRFFLFLCFALLSTFVWGQNNTCASAVELCLVNNVMIIDNCFNGNGSCESEAEEGPDYDCLGSQPFPSWYYFDIASGGDIVFEISQNSEFDENGNPVGTLFDVDYIVWGPILSELCDYESLQEDNIVSCSFSPDATETVAIPETLIGERYLLMVTNFSGQNGQIKIEKTGGSGELVCSTLSSSDIETSAIHIYPNPTNDYFMISSNREGDMFTVTLISLDGKEIPYGQVSAHTAVDISSLTAGVYFARIEHKENSVMKRINVR